MAEPGITYTITPNRRDVRRIRRTFRKVMRVGGDLRRPLGRTGLYIRRDAQRELRRRPRNWGPGTGRLSKSLAMRLERMSVTVGSNLAYAAVQQLGHPGIRPKGHKYLALPVRRDLRMRGQWPRDLPRDSMKFGYVCHIKIGTRSWIGRGLVQADAKVGEDKIYPAATVMFALVKVVRIKGRAFLRFARPARNFLFGELKHAYIQAWRNN